MSGVDHKDRDTADWTTSVKSNRFHLRTIWWAVDGALHAMNTTIKFVFLAVPQNHKAWEDCVKHRNARCLLQMDLSQELFGCALLLDWKDFPDPKGAPEWSRKKDFLPCDCKTCFHCKHGLTHGIDHKKKGSIRRTPSTKAARCSMIRERVSSYSHKCSVCERRLKKEINDQNSDLKYRDERKKLNGTYMGCVTCGVWVCEDCWDYCQHNMQGNAKGVGK